MTEELDQDIEQSVPGELSDEQLDKFFEDGGKEDAEPTIEPEPTTNTNDAPAPQDQSIEETSAAEEEKHARNYQAAMKEERARRQEMQRQLEETKIQQARMEERFQAIQKQLYQEPAPKVPSYDEDPLGNLHQTQKELAEYVIKQNEFLRQQQEVQRVQQAENEFLQTYSAKAREYQATNPDFMESYNYLTQKKMAEYMAAGLSQAQADYQIKMEEAKVVSLAFQQGVNPAERIFAMAKASGFSKSPPLPTATVDKTAMDETAKKLEQIQKGIQANKSLGGAAGKSDTKSGLSLQAIADMDDDEFDKVDWAKVIKAA